MINTVAELVAELLKQDQNAKVGVALSSVTGWVQQVRRVTTTEDGLVVVDQTEESVTEDESNIL